MVSQGIKFNYMEIQPGDVPATFADSSDLEKWIDFKPNTTIKEGVKRFIIWYKEYNKI